MSTTSPVPRPNPDKIRVEFIGMAFALAIGELGLEIGKLYLDGVSLREHWYLFTHILLAIYIIASSWVGWQLSESRGNEEVVKDPFSLSFLILLLDLLLVICYFIIVKSIDKNPESPTCNSEIYWSWFIFILYACWDILTKLIIEDKTSGKIKREPILKKYFNRAYQAPICFCITYFIIWPLRTVSTPKTVICVDIMLISVFILFRGMKSLKNNIKRVPIYILTPVVVFILSFLVLKNIISL